jgi:hypothetical protein
MKKLFLLYIVIPMMLVIEVKGVSALYPIWKESLLKMILLFTCVYATYDIYRYIKNWCDKNY